MGNQPADVTVRRLNIDLSSCPVGPAAVIALVATPISRYRKSPIALLGLRAWNTPTHVFLLLLQEASNRRV